MTPLYHSITLSHHDTSIISHDHSSITALANDEFSSHRCFISEIYVRQSIINIYLYSEYIYFVYMIHNTWYQSTVARNITYFWYYRSTNDDRIYSTKVEPGVLFSFWDGRRLWWCRPGLGLGQVRPRPWRSDLFLLKCLHKTSSRLVTALGETS